ncbi:RNA polymerase subunit sigma-24 [Opitutaceae bacterium EW11]|nr:RNA polymerase subunit sigma-24 [Opitutaceae bacterium EW11]
MPSSPEYSQWLVEQVRPHEPLLRGYLQKRFPSLPDHDDIVQEAYARLLRTGSGRPLSSAKAFLFTIARNVAIDMLRRQQTVAHERISEVTEEPVLEESPGVAEALDRKQREAVLIEAIAALPDRCREVIVLRHLEGLSYKEIAERLGISPNTVKLHIIKGTKDCAAFFRTQGLLQVATRPAVSEGSSQS